MRESTPDWERRLATLRLGTGAFAWVYMLARIPHVFTLSELPASRFAAVGLCTPFEHAPPNAVIGLALLVCILTGPAFILGWRFRVFGPAFAWATCFALSYRNSFGMVFHTENLMVLHLLVLSIAPSARVLSRDADARVPSDPESARWGVRLIGLLTTLTYLVAGLAKLRVDGWSLAWADGELLRAHVAFDNLRKAELGHIVAPLGPWIVRQGWVFAPLAWLTLALELLAPLALLSDRAGRVWALAAWGFHFGVLWTMAIFFPYPLLGFGLASFFTVEKIWKTQRGQAFGARLRLLPQSAGSP